MTNLNPAILLIDDEPQWQNYIISHFSDEFEILLAPDFQIGLEQLNLNVKIKMVMLDFTVKPNQKQTVITGLDVIQKIRLKYPQILLIVYSAYPLNNNIPSSFLQADLVLTKQEIVSNASFKKKLRNLLNRPTVIESESPLSLADVRNLFDKEFTKLSAARENTLSIPEEGNFELIKSLIGFKKDIERQIATYDYARNVFLMMKFRQNNRELSDFIVENLEKNGFNGVRADANHWNITHNVYNPIAVLYCCKYGIALFDEAEEGQAYSPNVAYELGIMHTQSKTCLVLKHNSLPYVPFDLVKDLYTVYEKELEVRRHLNNWLIQITK